MVKLLQLWVNNQGGTHYVQNMDPRVKQLTAWWD